MVTRQTQEVLELSNGIVIEIHSSNFKSIRGYTVVAAILDEIAFWSDATSLNPDSEILAALRPTMATVPNALLLAISSPYARRGELWRAFQAHFGKEHDPVIVWQADTRTMNPLVSEGFIADAYARDEASASAEFGAQFRRDIETFISHEVVEGCVVPTRRELSPVEGTTYVAFCDPSGGSQDSFTLAIAHKEQERIVVDAIREYVPPFSPESVIAELGDVLHSYRISRVTADKYAGVFPKELFAKHGIQYDSSPHPSRTCIASCYRC